jgi:hypothetical protein
MKKRIIVNLFLSVFVIVGMVVAWQGKKRLAIAKRSAGWPYVMGKVISSEMEIDRDTDSDRGTSITYSAEVMFEYEVGGVSYAANRVSFGQYGSSSPGPARKILNKYPADEAVKVYYDPADPQNSVLEPGVTFSTYMVLIGGLVFIFSGALFLFIINKYWSSQKGQAETQNQKSKGGDAYE